MEESEIQNKDLMTLTLELGQSRFKQLWRIQQGIYDLGIDIELTNYQMALVKQMDILTNEKNENEI